MKKTKVEEERTNAFIAFLVAAMKDAGGELVLTQLKTMIDVPGKGMKQVRIIIVPEKMEHESMEPYRMKN